MWERFWTCFPWVLSAALAIVVAGLGIELKQTRFLLISARREAAALHFLEREAQQRAVKYALLLEEATRQAEQKAHREKKERPRQKETR